MAEYYNQFNKHYMWLVSQPTVSYRFKVELLDHWEQSHGEIVRDISESENYNININKSQGTRRTCTLTFIDKEGKYLPSINNPFWYNKKFKLYVGIVDGLDTHWYTQGVFVCSKATATRHVVTINGVDKYGFLDGTLNTHMMTEKYVIDVGSRVEEVVKETLMLELGNGKPIDPITPLIDPKIGNRVTEYEISLDPGVYLGEILSQLCSMFGADIYYDINGRLRVEHIFNDDIPFYYVYRASYWHFNDIHETYSEPSVDYGMDGVNYIVVSTDNTEGEVYSYTAINDNPHSPVCVSSVGYRCDPDSPITYIPVGDTSIILDPVEKCRQHAEWLLLQKTCMSLSISFQSIMLPHLTEGEIITVTDKFFGFDEQKFLVQSITFNGKDKMNISAINIQWLPTDTETTNR